MILNIDVLRPCVMLRILSERDSTLTVGVDGVLVADVVSQFLENSVDPDLLLESVEYRHVLRFRSREGH